MKTMKNRLLSKLPLVLCLLAVGAAGLAPAAASAESEPEKEQTSQATRRLLREHGLKRLAGNDPAEAIRSLDRLRSEGTTGAQEISAAIAEVALAAAPKVGRGLRLGFFLCAAAETYAAALEEGANEAGGAPASGPPPAIELHGKAVEGLIAGLQATGAAALGGRAQRITGPLARYELSWVDAAEDWTPATHEFIAASGLRRGKKQYLGQRSGIGAPVVAVAKGDAPSEEDFEGGLFPIYRYYYPLTAVLELGDAEGEQPRPATVRLVDSRRHDVYRLGEADYPLAIDLGAQLAAMSQEIDATFGKSGVIHSGKYLSLAGLYLLEPLREGKIPAVLIHGLSSSPKTWAEAFDAFQLDPELRRGYQFWFFAYPTGLPFPYSAMLLRRALDVAVDRLEAGGSDPRHRRTVLLGHSMGGLLTRMQVTPTAQALWNAVFTVAPEEAEIAPEDSELLQEILIVEPLPFVERVVFCSTPHRGSKYAANALGKLGASLVKVPAGLADLGKRVVLGTVDALTPGAEERGKMPDSVQSLQPEFPILVALDELEIDPRVTYHSIIGDRGKGDTPESSDGVVPYWSSHLEGAASERIVPSGHGSHKHPEGVEELRRILHEHLEAGRRPETALDEGVEATRPSVVRRAVADLAQRLGVGVEEIEVRQFEEVTWPDASAGCPEPGMVYAQVLTKGSRIGLAVEDRSYTYHAAEGREPFLCEDEPTRAPGDGER